jgi:hypothetical protein
MTRTLRLLGLVCGLCAATLAVPAGAGAQTRPWTDRGFLHVRAGAQVTSGDFASTVTFTLHAEPANLRSNYDNVAGPFFDVGGGVRVWRNLAVGVSVTRVSSVGTATVRASLPHPFDFERPREVAGTAERLRREEIALCLAAVWVMPINERFSLSVSGGPSVVHLKQDLVDRVQFSETYPFDEAAFTGAGRVANSAMAIGLSAGADAVYLVSRHIGIGAELRFLHASVALEPVKGQRAPSPVGGLQTAAGIRVRF